jgi:hypothetical protein
MFVGEVLCFVPAGNTTGKMEDSEGAGVEELCNERRSNRVGHTAAAVRKQVLG